MLKIRLMSPVFNACKKSYFIETILVILKSLSSANKTIESSQMHPFQMCEVKKKDISEINETKNLAIIFLYLN